MGIVAKFKNAFFGGSQRTRNYDAVASTLDWWWQSDRPPFSLYQIELMRRDHQVAFGLSIGNGVMAKAEHECISPSTEIKAFVEKQIQRIWSQEINKILKARAYGYAALQAVYEFCDDRIEFDTFRDFSPRDVRPRRLDGKRVGFSVQSVRVRQQTAAGRLNIHLPQAVWLANREEYNRSYGVSDLLPSYPPWYEKFMRGGGYDLRRLRMCKDAWVGDHITYPMGETWVNPDGTEQSWRDIVRQIAENRMTGGLLMLPSNTYEGTTNRLVEYTPPTGVQGEDQVANWIKDLDWDILDGLALPREVVEAAETGSGFSGRSVPFVSWLAGLDVSTSGFTAQINECSIKPMVIANFGVRASREYEIKTKPLLETVGDLMGSMGQPNASSAQPEGGRASAPGHFGVSAQNAREGALRLYGGAQQFSADDQESIENRTLRGVRAIADESQAAIMAAFKKKAPS